MSVYGFTVDWWNILIALFYVVSVYMSEDYVYKRNIKRGLDKAVANTVYFKSLRMTLIVDGILLGVFGYYAYGGDHPYLPIGYILVSSILYMGSMFWLRKQDKEIL